MHDRKACHEARIIGALFKHKDFLRFWYKVSNMHIETEIFRYSMR